MRSANSSKSLVGPAPDHQHLDKRVFCRLVRPPGQKISDLAVIQTVKQPSVAKSLAIILELKLSSKPR